MLAPALLLGCSWPQGFDFEPRRALICVHQEGPHPFLRRAQVFVSTKIYIRTIVATWFIVATLYLSMWVKDFDVNTT